MKNKNHKLIDDYLSGRSENADGISPDSPDFIFQKEVIEGIKDYRSTQLKARLAAVDTNISFFEFAKNSGFIKSFGGVLIASLIGIGVVIYGDETKDQSHKIVVNLPKQDVAPFAWSISDHIRYHPINNSIPESKNDANTNLVNAPVVVDVKTAVPVTSEEEPAVIPNVQVPNVVTAHDEIPEATGLDKINVEKPDRQRVSMIKVETKHTKDLAIRYKYYDGKLFLVGDFDLAPYEILEINSSSSRRIYIKYLDTYYKVNVTDKLQNLPEVKDQEVIRELELLKALK